MWISMPDDIREPVTFDDQVSLLSLVVRAFEDGARIAAGENDTLRLPTPVGLEGQVLYIQPPPCESGDPIPIGSNPDSWGKRR